MLLQLSQELPPSEWTNGQMQLDFGRKSFRFRNAADVTIVKCDSYCQLKHEFWRVDITTETAGYLREKYGFAMVSNSQKNPNFTTISEDGFELYFNKDHKPVATLLQRKPSILYGIDNLYYSLIAPLAKAQMLANKFNIYVKQSSSLSYE